MEKFYTILLLVFYALLFSCSEEDKTIVDYRCKVDVSNVQTEKVYANLPIPLNLSIIGNDEQIGEYEVCYTGLEGKGDILVDNLKLPEKEFVHFRGESITYIPLTLGKHRIKFTFKNEEFLTEHIHEINANDLVFEAQTKNLPEKLIVNKPLIFDIELIQKKESPQNEYSAKFVILKGKGDIQFFGIKDTIQSIAVDSLNSRAITTVYKVRVGSNKICYEAAETGENIILLQIQNQYGYEQNISIPLNIQLPDYSVNTTCDSALSIGTKNNFILAIKNTDQVDNSYSLSYRFLKNSGTIKVNNNELQAANTIFLSEGEHICEYVPHALGEAKIEFIAKDKYNTIRKDTIICSIQKTNTKVDITYNKQATLFDEQSIIFAVSKIGEYTGKYKFQLLQEDQNSLKIKVNGLVYSGAKMNILNPDNTIINFIPLKPGSTTLLLKIFDDYGNETCKELVFDVKNSSARIIIANNNPNLKLRENTSFNFAIDKQNYNGNFQFEINHTGKVGNLLVNGKSYRGGRMDVQNINNTLIQFTAVSIGTENITINILDDFGGVITENLIYNINNTSISVETNNVEKNLILGKETSFTFKANKPNYSENLYYEVQMVPEKGIINNEGIPLGSGKHAFATGQNIQLSFVPQEEGQTIINLTITDDYGAENKQSIIYSITNPPLQAIIQDFVSDVTLNTKNRFYLSASKAYYNDNFKCRITTTPEDAGTIQIDNVDYSGGNVVLNDPNNTLISFAPKIAGEINLNITLYDNLGGSTNKSLIYKVSNPATLVTVTNQNHSVKLNESTTFNFAVSKKNYDGEFQYEIIQDPHQFGSIFINGTKYSGGKQKVQNINNTLVEFTPTTLGEAILVLKISDNWGGIQETQLPFSINNTDVEITVNGASKNLILNTPSSFSFIAKKQMYVGTLKYSLELIPADAGSLTVNEQPYTPLFENIKMFSENTITSGNKQNVTFLPLKEGEATLLIKVSDSFNQVVTTTIPFSVTNPPIRIDSYNFNSEATIHTENSFNFAIFKDNYNKSFECYLKLVPENNGVLKVNNQTYSGDKIKITDVTNTKIGFIPNKEGSTKLELTVIDQIGGKQERTFEYLTENPPLFVSLSDITDNLTLDKRTSFSFGVSKFNYKGKYRFEISSENCREIKVGNEIYDNTQKEITNPLGTTISFIPTQTGQDIVKIKLTIQDDWGMKIEKNLVYSVENTGINLTINNIESELHVNQETKVNLLASKTGYTGKLQLELFPTPPDQGQIFVNKELYTSGTKDISVDTPIEISYIPNTEGKITLGIAVSDNFGGKTSRQIDYVVSNSPIKMEISDFVSTATYNSSSVFNFSVTKEHYNAPFKYSISTIPQNAGTIKVNNNQYAWGLQTLENPQNTRIEFVPTILGPVVIKITLSDETGKKLEKELNYNVTNTPIDLLVTNQETGLTINKSTTFNFAINKSGYKGTFLYEIISEPTVVGDFSINGTMYTGGKTPVKTATNTRVIFTPIVTGDVNLTLVIYDEYGGIIEKQLHYNVSNSNMELITSNVEKTLQLGKMTSFNYAIIKPNYAGRYQQEMIVTPEGAGDIKINSNNYSGGKVAVLNPANTVIDFISRKAGINTLLIKIHDEWGDEKVGSITFNCENPAIKINETNKETELVYNTPTNFNITIAKEFYTGNFKYQIEQVPANMGTIQIDAAVYNGGITQVTNPNNLQLTFIPHQTGNVSLKLSVYDDFEGYIEKNYTFNVTNPKIEVNVNEHAPDTKVNTPSTFNFSVTKPKYDGKFSYVIEQIPAGSGTIKVNAENYNGAKKEITNPNDNPVEFTAIKTGAVVLKLTVTDEWGVSSIKEIPFSISNTDIGINISGNEYDLLLNKKTTFNFSPKKPNYNGTFKATIKTEPESAGTLKINGSTYSGSPVTLQANNTIEFIPARTGATLLKINVTDELAGSKEVPINFNVTNPKIKVNVTNKENELIYNTQTSFNVALSKDYYNDTFDYEIEQEPVNSGSINVDNIPYSGGAVTAINHSNIIVKFTPKKEGRVTLKLKFSDKTGTETREVIDFNVTNPKIEVSVNGYAPDTKVNTPSTFNFSVTKPNYGGKFSYVIEQIPAGSGTIKVNAENYNGAKKEITNPNDNPVEFTAIKTGAVVLKLTVTDEWEVSSIKEIPFSISNTDIGINISGNEYDLLLNKKTTFNFSPKKPNYNGTFKATIKTEPESAGTLKINGSTYSGSPVTLQANNTIEFIPARTGATLLKINVTDELAGSKEVPINFNVTNPKIKVNVTNKENELIYNTQTSFNVALSKDYYNDTFDYEIEQEPVNSGSINVDNIPYSGGAVTAINHSNIIVKFTPKKEGRVTLKLKFSDKTGTETREVIDFNVTNPKIEVSVNGYAPDTKVNTPSTFNFSVTKPNYGGKFSYVIEQIPAGSGTIKVNAENYNGAKKEITNPNDNPVEFTAIKTGAVVLKLTVTDEWGVSSIKEIPFSISNTDIGINISGNEYDLLLNKKTTFNFSPKKPNYNGTFKATIKTEPESAGTLKINGSTYSGSPVTLQANNTIEFIPARTGATLLKINVTDELAGSKEVPINFNVTNPKIKVNVTNKENELIYNTQTSFNVALSKDYYNDTFDYEIEQEPVNSGSINVDNIPYSGGAVTAINHSNIIVKFTPKKEGRVTLKLKFSDKTGTETREVIDFNVTNPKIEVSVNGYAPDTKVNTPSTFNFSVTKPNYGGKFSYVIEQIPAGSGTIKVNAENYNGAKKEITNPNDNPVEFTAIKTGAVVLKLTVTDEWGVSDIKEIPFSVSNTDIAVNVTDKENDLLLNKATTFNFSVSKINYSGTFKAEIIQEPVDCGTVRLNNSAYTSGKVSLQANNTITFTPLNGGAIMLKLKVYDELQGEKETALNFNVTNPAINVDVTNKENSVIYNTATSFNVAFSKENYTGKIKYRFSTLPSSSGEIAIGGKIHDGNYAEIASFTSLQVSFTPKREGAITLLLEATDETGNILEKILDFNVTNPPLTLSINNSSTELTLGNMHNFSITPAKSNYNGTFNYQITQYPYASANILVDNKNETNGKLTKNPANISIKPNSPGSVVLNIKITDEWGKEVEKQLNFNVTNTPIALEILNNESQVILNTPTNFNFKVQKKNYNDNETLSYTITPTSNGSISVDNKQYNGTSISVPYSKIKQGIPVIFTPTREGISSLTLHIADQYNETTIQTIDFNVTNPTLNLNLIGANSDQINQITLGETFKFSFNIEKPYYNDDFAYTITLQEADAGLLATSDITPRSTASGSNVLTGVIKSSEFGSCIGEIRFTPNNSNYLAKDVTITVQIRDKWNNTKSLPAKFHIVASAINVNVNRKSSIVVEEPYVFSYTVHKPNYTGNFKYSIIGFDDSDKVETSKDGITYTNYIGGKYPILDKDHSYIRFTPSKTGICPLRLFVYDDNNSETVKELNFDIKAPEIKIRANRNNASGYTSEYLPFEIVAEEEKGEAMSVNFAVEKSNVVLKFNGQEVATSKSRTVPEASVSIKSGANNNLEIMSRTVGTYSVRTTARNRFNNENSVTTNINVSQAPSYGLTTNVIGSGTINKNPNSSNYSSGATVELTAEPSIGYKFTRWQGSISSTENPMTIVMNGDKNIVAVFEKENYILTTSIQGLDIYSDGAATESYLQVTRSPNQNEYATGTQVTLSTINNLPNLWKFWGWCERNGDLFSTNATTTVTIDGNKDIQAVFKSPHSITKIYVNGYRTIEYDVKARDLMGFEKYLNGDITKSTFTGEIWIESLAIDANEALLKLCTIRVYINDKLIPLLTDKLTSPYRIKNNEGNLSFEISSGKSGNLRFFLDPAYITSGKFKIILDMPLRYQTVTGTIQ